MKFAFSKSPNANVCARADCRGNEEAFRESVRRNANLENLAIGNVDIGQVMAIVCSGLNLSNQRIRDKGKDFFLLHSGPPRSGRFFRC